MTESPQPFRVIYPGQVRDQLLAWGRRANDPTLRASLANALSHVQEHLTTNPLEWGEIAYRLHHAGLTVCDGFHERIHVRFAVDESRRLVYVVRFKLLPGHPLAPPS
jgi:hypothetical protein